jgi:hypothetical protein
MLHIIALAQYAVVYTRGWAVNSQVARVRLKAENDQLRQYVPLLTEEIDMTFCVTDAGLACLSWGIFDPTAVDGESRSIELTPFRGKQKQ